jgi:hypothetical protein
MERALLNVDSYFPPLFWILGAGKKHYSQVVDCLWVWKEKHLQRTALFPAIRTKSTGTGVKSKSKPAKKKQPKPSKATVFARCFTWYNKWYGRGPSNLLVSSLWLSLSRLRDDEIANTRRKYGLVRFLACLSQEACHLGAAQPQATGLTQSASQAPQLPARPTCQAGIP